jgi:hypothetical protein
MGTNRRIALLLVLCTAALALLMVGLQRSKAQGGNISNTSHDFAVGAAYTAAGQFSFAAQNAPIKNNSPISRGYVVYQNPLGTVLSGPVDCLDVNGADAQIRWHIAGNPTCRDMNGVTTGNCFLLDVTDGGNPTLEMDMASQTITGDSSGCSAQGGTNLLVRGNIVVNDDCNNDCA